MDDSFKLPAPEAKTLPSTLHISDTTVSTPLNFAPTFSTQAQDLFAANALTRPHPELASNTIDMPPLAFFASNAAGSDLAPQTVSTLDAVAARPIQPGDALNVSVQYADQITDKTQKPDIVIDKNGQVIQNTDLSQGIPQNLIVQVDRPDDAQQAAAQKASLNNFLQNDLAQNVQQAGDINGVKLNDTNNLIAQDLRAALEQPAVQDVPPLPPQQAPEQVPDINHQVQDGQPGRMSHQRANDYFPQRDVPRRHDESDQTVALKDMLASLFANKEHPYETVKPSHNHGFRFGRYGASYDNTSNYLEQAMTPEVLALLGHPPDWSKLGAILEKLRKEHPDQYEKFEKNLKNAEAKGAMSHEMASHLGPDKDGKFTGAENLGKFVEKLHGGKGVITADDVKQNFGKESQEAMAQHQLQEYAKSGADSSKIAVAVGLDKKPQDLTAADMATPEAKDFANRAQKYYGVAYQREHAGKDDDIAWKGTGNPASPMAYEIAKHALDNAHTATPGGWCARGVFESLQNVDRSLVAHSNDAWKLGQDMLRNGKWEQVSLDKAEPGDVVVKHSGVGKAGHIEIVASKSSRGFVLGSDFTHVKQDLAYTNGGYYNGTIALRYVGKNGADQGQA